jgi:hypothetical protein
MPKIRDLGINSIPTIQPDADGWRMSGGCHGQSPNPCPGASPKPCPGYSPKPCPGQSPQPCPGASPIWKKGTKKPVKKKTEGLSSDEIVQLRQQLDRAIGKNLVE